MARTWKVGNTTSGRTGKLTEFFVTDANDKVELEDRPKAAIFPISLMFDQEIQETRAEKYADYLNKLDEAARVAHEQTHLIDILSRP